MEHGGVNPIAAIAWRVDDERVLGNLAHDFLDERVFLAG